ncbi:thioredoxin family protein [Psychroflexus salis]|uniref:Thioredoxin family protein n=1 Tax=Psychroflexus salis TaxID=1526574 RepID=A0A917A0F3_9FLAO|nr:thioredoxin family protein [Psychroflexus salis]GGE21090.1 thioredoxin family protein [Psychroflexus salis]
MKNIFKSIRILVLISIPFVLFSFFNPTLKNAYAIGDQVENFELPNIDGKYVSLSDYTNQKGVIVIFTCNTCPYAVAYEDRIIALHKKYAEKGYPVLAINPNDPEVQPGDSFAEMKNRAKEKGFTFPYLLDEKQQVYPKFGASRTPHVFLLHNENSNFVLRYIGAIDDNYKNAAQVKIRFLENAIQALNEGKEIELKETKAIGCTIKTK